MTLKILLILTIVVLPMAGFLYLHAKLKPKLDGDQSTDTGGGAS